MGNESEWNARYYAENRERISEHRRGKYLHDREYRVRAKLRARRYREQHRKVIAKRMGTREWVMPRVIEIGRRQLAGHFVGDVTRRTGLTKRAILRWEKLGVLPRAVCNAMGWRMYTEEQISLMAQALYESGIMPGKRTRPEKLEHFSRIVHAKWTSALSGRTGDRRANGRRTGTTGG